MLWNIWYYHLKWWAVSYPTILWCYDSKIILWIRSVLGLTGTRVLNGIFHIRTHLKYCDIVVVKVFRCRQPTWSVFVPSVDMLDGKEMCFWENEPTIHEMKSIHISIYIIISQIHQKKKDKFGNLKGLNLAESCIPTQHQAQREDVLGTSVTLKSGHIWYQP